MPVNNSTFLYGVAKWIVDPLPGRGTHTTIQSAINSASAGEVVFIRSATYTEDLTMKPGVLLTAFGGTSTSTVAIVGKMTFSEAGTYLISDLTLQTNSDFAIVVSGSNLINVQMNNVNVQAFDNIAISLTNSNASTTLIFLYSLIACDTTPTALYDVTGISSLSFYDCVTATAGSTTASNNSAGSVAFYNCTMSTPHSLSGTGGLNLSECRLDTAVLNTTCISATGTSQVNILMSELFSGTASCVSIGAGCNSVISHVGATSSNTNVFTGAGTLNYAFISFLGSSSGHNVTTETALNTLI